MSNLLQAETVKFRIETRSGFVPKAGTSSPEPFTKGVIMWKENEEMEELMSLHQLESEKLPGHLTILGVSILMICVNSFHNTSSVIPFRIFNYFT